MEPGVSVFDPDGRHVNIYDGEGNLMRRETVGPGRELKAPPPDWFVELYDSFNRYMQTVLDPDGLYEIEFSVPEEGTEHFTGTRLGITENSSAFNGLWITVHTAVRDYVTPFSYVNLIKATVNNPRAFL